MSLRDEIVSQIADLEQTLSVVNRFPADTYNLGTVVVFAADHNNLQWHYIKVAEETWKKFGTSAEATLAKWILSAIQSDIGYFEIYVLAVAPNPIYTSA
jgi:hypothetical protein